MAKQGASELKDLDVDRVDGVDKPATGRNFLLFKSEDGAAAIMKGYGAVATAAHAVLQKMRTDKNAVVSRKSAIALNGLAQILGEDAVFVGKSVPTQPYVFVEPDADKRGPADEDLGGNFTPRSMPGSMVGSVQFRLADGVEETKGAKMYDEDDEEDAGKGKGKRKAAAVKGDKDDDQDDDDMDASERANRGVARKSEVEALAKTVGLLAETVRKAIEGPEDVKKRAGDDEDVEQVRRPARSRQVLEDDQPVRVRKGAEQYDARFGVSFADTVFGRK